MRWVLDHVRKGRRRRTYCWTWRKGSSSLVEDIILSGGGLGLVRPSAGWLAGQIKTRPGTVKCVCK